MGLGIPFFRGKRIVLGDFFVVSPHPLRKRGFDMREAGRLEGSRSRALVIQRFAFTEGAKEPQGGSSC